MCQTFVCNVYRYYFKWYDWNLLFLLIEYLCNSENNLYFIGYFSSCAKIRQMIFKKFNNCGGGTFKVMVSWNFQKFYLWADSIGWFSAKIFIDVFDFFSNMPLAYVYENNLRFFFRKVAEYKTIFQRPWICVFDWLIDFFKKC